MTHVTCRLTVKNRDQLRNPTLSNELWATFPFFCLSPSTGVGSKFYISTTFITGMMNCMHLAGGRDCNPSRDGRYYVGSTSVTKSGRTCQAWTSQSLYLDDQFPDGSRAAAFNYCRNPEYRRDGLWCYTTDPDVPWEACNVTDCGQSLSYTTRTFVESKMPFHAPGKPNQHIQ